MQLLMPICFLATVAAWLKRRLRHAAPTSLFSTPTIWVMVTCTGTTTTGAGFPCRTSTWLADTGIRFTDGHSSSSVCSPSRYALLT